MHLLLRDSQIIGYVLPEKLQCVQNKLEEEKSNLHTKTINEINNVKNIFISNLPENPLYLKSNEEINDLYKILRSLEDKESKQKIAILIDEYKKIVGLTSNYESSNILNQRFNYFLKVNGEIRKTKLEYTVNLFYLFGNIYRMYYTHNQFDNSIRELCGNKRSTYYNDNRVFFESIIKHFDINYGGVNEYVKNNFKYHLVKINETQLEDIKI